MNIRNFLVGLTIAEVQEFLKVTTERGQHVKAGFIKEWLDELIEEFTVCEDGPGGDDCITPTKIY